MSEVTFYLIFYINLLHSQEWEGFLCSVSNSGLQGDRSREGRQVLNTPQHVWLSVLTPEPEQRLVSGGQALAQLHDRGVGLVVHQQI